MISVVVPEYAEGSQVRTTVEQINSVLAASLDPYEIIVVDDGSPDDSWELLQGLQSQFPKLVIHHHSKNLGPGAAFRTGFAHSKGDFVVTLDCDLSFDPSDIPRIVERLQFCDVVIGTQHGPGSRMENVPVQRIFLSKLAHFLDRSILGGQLLSYSSFFVGYRGSLIRSLRFENNGFDAQCEILVRLLRQKSNIQSIPCRLAWKQKNRKSSMSLFREGRRRLRLWWGYHRFRSQIPPSK